MSMCENASVRFDVTASELRDHCTKRAEYHRGREKFYAAEEQKFKDEVDELVKQNVAKYSNSVTSSNKQRMEQSKNHHADRARFFEFCTKHLVSQDMYRLLKEELVDFEMIPSC